MPPKDEEMGRIITEPPYIEEFDCEVKTVKEYIMICNPSDFEKCKQTVITKEGFKIELTQSSLVERGKICLVNMETIPFYSLGICDKVGGIIDES